MCNVSIKLICVIIPLIEETIYLETQVSLCINLFTFTQLLTMLNNILRISSRVVGENSHIGKWCKLSHDH